MHRNKEKAVGKKEYLQFTHLRCTPREYELSAILRVANDAVPDENRAVGKIANNADADRGFLAKNRGASCKTEK